VNETLRRQGISSSLQPRKGARDAKARRSKNLAIDDVDSRRNQRNTEHTDLHDIYRYVFASRSIANESSKKWTRILPRLRWATKATQAFHPPRNHRQQPMMRHPFQTPSNVSHWAQLLRRPYPPLQLERPQRNFTIFLQRIISPERNHLSDAAQARNLSTTIGDLQLRCYKNVPL
jgi:hypothetical protein